MKLKSKMRGALAPVVKPSKTEKLHNEKHFASVVAVFPDAFVSGRFCDVKIVCMVSHLFCQSFENMSLPGHRFVGSQDHPFIGVAVHTEASG